MDSVATIDQRVLERARISRDPRFDGRFYVGVMTSGLIGGFMLYGRWLLERRFIRRDGGDTEKE